MASSKQPTPGLQVAGLNGMDKHQNCLIHAANTSVISKRLQQLGKLKKFTRLQHCTMKDERFKYFQLSASDLTFRSQK